MVHQTCPVKLVKHQTNVVEDFRAKSNVRMNIISKDSVSVALATTLATKRSMQSTSGGDDDDGGGGVTIIGVAYP
ncbi:hypothetical protein BLOT_004007 [Blomia tropicalis]|nr:hypothetical protein BLOT_004007 [Blomia tropicalis]